MTQEVARALPGQELDYVEPFRELGIVGLDALVAAFPGPTRGNVFDLARPPRGRDISAIARVLHELGPKAFAHLRQLLAHASSDTRYLALLLVVDADHAELADAIAGRLFDADYAVAKLAERAVEAAKDSERRDALGAQLSAFVRSRSIDAARRLRAVELIGQLRLERGLSALIESLDDPHPKISASAHAGLVQLTAHDCGSSSRDWMRFLRDHRTSARTSWLLLALSGKSTEHRDVAAQELARVTGETFGYVPGCGEARVEAVRSAYARLLRGR